MPLRSVSNPKKQQTGFTIVELLIVIVVIVILAAIVIVTYKGTTQRAANAQLLSDLDNAASQLESDYLSLKTYPASASAANGGQGLKPSSGTTFTYTPTNNQQAYCLQAVSVKAGTKIYNVTDNSKISEGACTFVPGAPINSNTYGGSYINTGSQIVQAYWRKPSITGSGVTGYKVRIAFSGCSTYSREFGVVDESGATYTFDAYNDAENTYRVDLTDVGGCDVSSVTGVYISARSSDGYGSELSLSLAYDQYN